MTESRIVSAGAAFVAALAAARDPGVPESEALDALRGCGALLRRVEYETVTLIAALERIDPPTRVLTVGVHHQAAKTHTDC